MCFLDVIYIRTSLRLSLHANVLMSSLHALRSTLSPGRMLFYMQNCIPTTHISFSLQNNQMQCILGLPPIVSLYEHMQYNSYFA